MAEPLRRKERAMKKKWAPPEFIAREQILKDSGETLALPDIRVKKSEDIFRIRVLELDWDIGAVVYQPEEPACC